MNNLRKYGQEPFKIAVIHGADQFRAEKWLQLPDNLPLWGVLEPIQTATSLDGQVDELHSVLEVHAQLPVTLIGYSWGAWLSYILTARFPEIVEKLILVSSGPFKEKYVEKLQSPA